jgi:DNA polymerase-3 subunit delta'
MSKLSHALLLHAPHTPARLARAEALASRILQTTPERIASGNYPDYRLYRPEGKLGQHSIDSIRALSDLSHETPFEEIGQVFVIDAAEKMQPAAASALLKTLEEPPPRTTLILLVEHLHELMPTIRSRLVLLPIDDAIAPPQAGGEASDWATQLLQTKAGSLAELLLLERFDEHLDAIEDPTSRFRFLRLVQQALLEQSHAAQPGSWNHAKMAKGRFCSLFADP